MNLHPKDPCYWDDQDLEKELHRVYDICHGCRLCFNLCPSFSEMFRYIDEKDGEVKQVDRAKLSKLTDLCYQCKLCINKCPYSPPHQWDVDIPRLMLREKAIRVKKEGLSLREKFLADADRAGKIGCHLSSLSNWANGNPLARRVMEKVIGIHHERKLPEYSKLTFEEWFRKRPNSLCSDQKVAFFYTCFVNYNAPEQGIAAVDVLEKNGFEVIVPKQICCGMPFLDAGDIERATANMEVNLRNFKNVIKEGIPVVTVGPTCSYVLKNEFSYFTQNSDAAKLSRQTKDLSEFLVELKNKNRLNTDFIHTSKTKIAYQIPCHLRAQNIGYKTMELLRTIPNVHLELVEQCSAMDGTWGMKKEYYQISIKLAARAFREIQQAEADEVCTDCPLSAIQIEQGTGKKPSHPVQILHRAYGMKP